MIKHLIRFIFFLLTVNFIFFGCTPEYFVVKNFKESNNISVLVLPCDVILKTNTTIVDLYPDFSKLPKALQDTIWNVNTKFLEKLPDTLLINTFYNTLINQLKLTEVKIFSKSDVEKFYQNDTNAYVLKIAQIEMEENIKKIPYSQPIDYDSEVYKEVEIKTLSFNVWFELYKASNDTIPLQILYSSQVISDIVEGRFAQSISGNYEFKFKRKDIDTSDIVPMVNSASNKMSQYFYNHLINVYAAKVYQSYGYNLRYIGNQMNKKKGYSIYYPSEDERFIEIKKAK